MNTYAHVTKKQQNFNSRTHKGCDTKNGLREKLKEISIHAPIKDATRRADDVRPQISISIHAPIKDATNEN